MAVKLSASLPAIGVASSEEIFRKDLRCEAPREARPAGEAFEATLAREEIASLRQERSRLMQEVEAARILLEDHRRLTASLAESTATNEGAALELGVLEGDTARWRHRHGVAMARLDELAALLLEAEAREATLAGELVDTQRRLDALDAVNRDD